MQLILIVEDEYGSAEILQLVLEAHGYRVASAANGQLALELLQGELPSVIVSDYMMPHMNGAELGEALRANPAWADIPFVFVSGTTEDVVCKAFGDYDGFLAKPHDIEALLAIVRELAEGGRKARVRSKEVDASMRQLLKGIELPPSD